MTVENLNLVRKEFASLLEDWRNPNPHERVSIVDAIFIFRLLLGRSPNFDKELNDIIWDAREKTLAEYLETILSSHEFSGKVGFVPANKRFMADLQEFRFWFDTSDREMGLRMGLGLYEPETADFLKSCVRPGMTCYDIGAQTGFVTCMLASLVGKQGAVFSFEPNPKSFELLALNIQENGTGAFVDARNVACSDHHGEIPMTIASGMFIADRHAVDAMSIPCIKLDDEELPAPDIIKIDVEGHEPAVIKGMEKILSDSKPVVMMEINAYWLESNSNTTGREVIRNLNDLGYDVFPIESPRKIIEWREFTQNITDNCNVVAIPRP